MAVIVVSRSPGSSACAAAEPIENGNKTAIAARFACFIFLSPIATERLGNLNAEPV
jgi:hypothetical protein